MEVSGQRRRAPCSGKVDLSYCRDAQVQHRRAGARTQALLHRAAEPVGPRRRARTHPRRAVLRASCTAADRQDLRPARVAGSAEQRGRGRLPLRVREHRGRADGARRRGTGRARHPWRAGRSGTVAGRRVPGPDLVRCPGEIRSRTRTRGCIDPLVHGRSEAPGTAHRRDRLADRRLPDRGAAAVARRLRPASRGVSAERGAVRGARRARLPHPVELGERGDCRRQRVQREGPIAALGGLLASRGTGASRPAHRRDRAGVHPGSAGVGVDADAGSAVAGERARPPGVLRRRGGPGPLARHHRVRPLRCAGASDSKPCGAPRPARRQAPGGPGAAGHRAAAERRRRGRILGPRPRVRARPRPDCPRRPAAHREPHLRGGGAARARLPGSGEADSGPRLVRRRRRRSRHARSCSAPSRRSSASTPSTGWGASTTPRPARSSCCSRSCSGW